MEVGVLVRGDVGWARDEQIDVTGRVVELEEVLGQNTNVAGAYGGGLPERALHHVELRDKRCPGVHGFLVRVDLRLDRFRQPS